jgi:serine/threonine protein kinase/streptogramin lyase
VTALPLASWDAYVERVQTPRESGDLKPGVEFAGYRIVSVLGRGGMSVVYLAEHLGLQRKVALKLLAPQLAEDPRFRDRFVRESQVAAGIDHPNVIPIYEAGQGSGVLFIAMRYVEGTDLRALLQAEGALDPSRTVSFLRQLAGALDAAHARGLVHRDVKPGNVLIARAVGSEAEEHVYLSDFGLTKRAASDSGITGTGQFVGTLDYAAPEQFEGKPLDARTDVYSLGCLLYECLAGHAPFRRDNDAAVMYAHLLDDAPPLTEQRPGLPGEIDAVIARAMTKRPDLRYQSAGELSAAVRAALGREHTSPVGTRGTMARSRRRGGIVAALAVGALVIGTIWFALARSAESPSGADSGSRSPGAGAAPPIGSVLKIDPASEEVVKAFQGPTPDVAGGALIPQVAVGEGGIWVLDARGLTPIDPDTGEIGNPIPPRAVVFGVVPDVAIGLGDVVVTDSSVQGTVSRGAISRIDPATGRRRTIAFSDTGLPTGVAIGGRAIWETFGGGTLLRIDPRTFHIDDRFELGGSADSVAVSDDAVWVGDTLGSTVRRIDPSTGKVSEPIQLTGSVDGLAAESDRVWVLDQGTGTVTPVEASAGVGQSIRIGEDPTDLIAAFGAIWISDGGGALWRVDPVTHEATSIDVGAPLASVTPDPKDGTLVVLVSGH